MANSIVQVLPDGAGKKIQTFENTVGANVVQTQAIVQVDSTGTEVVAQTNALTDTQLRATAVPVSGTVATGGLTDTQLRATAVPVSGTVTANAGTGTLAVSAASLPLPAGAATAAKQPAIGTAGTSSVDVLTVQGRAAMTPLLTDGSATTQPVSGTVTANVGTGTRPVSGTFWQATQPVSGTVTANAGTGTMAVSGTFWQATQPVSGTVTANAGTGTMAVSGPLTDTQLRATAVPVSGTVTANAGTGTQAVSLASVPSHAVTNAGTFAVQATETQPAGATLSNIANAVSSATALALNTARRGASFFNDDTAASVYLKPGTTASATSFTIKIGPGGFYELPSPVYTGRVDVIATAATGTLRVTEFA